jgi:hypothetical protein
MNSIQEYSERVRTSLPTLYGTNPTINAANIARWINTLTNNGRFKFVPDDVRNSEYDRALTNIYENGYPTKFIKALQRIRKKELFLVIAKVDEEDSEDTSDDTKNNMLKMGIMRHEFVIRFLNELL